MYWSMVRWVKNQCQFHDVIPGFINWTCCELSQVIVRARAHGFTNCAPPDILNAGWHHDEEVVGLIRKAMAVSDRYSWVVSNGFVWNRICSIPSIAERSLSLLKWSWIWNTPMMIRICWFIFSQEKNYGNRCENILKYSSVAQLEYPEI